MNSIATKNAADRTVAQLSGLPTAEATSDGLHRAGEHGVTAVYRTRDGKVEFIVRGGHVTAFIPSGVGYSATYPVRDVRVDRPVEAVLMDLDGTSVHSEEFWIWLIERTTESLLQTSGFKFTDEDHLHVTGNSISEHLKYCIDRYCPGAKLDEARSLYMVHARREIGEILAGRGHKESFRPAPGLKEFLLELKKTNIRIALVTSGLHEKAWPEIVAAFNTMGLGNPSGFYDAIITAGFLPGRGQPGTIGELALKPHPWLYAEACTIGLGIPYERRHRVIGIEDSAAGVCSVRLAGFAVIGKSGGNIEKGGVKGLCEAYLDRFDEMLGLF